MHELVPEHEKISEEEKKKLLDQYNISLKQLPKILKEDPAAVTLQAKTGDILKIKRKSQTAGESIYYRVVV